MPSVADVCRWLERFAPPRLAAEWDNTGLLLGDGNAPAERILTCLTVTPAVVAEAVAERVQMIVSHHPILFRATKNLSANSAEGRLLAPLSFNSIAVYSPHTSFDNCAGGINDQLSASFGLTGVKPLRPKSGGPGLKLVVFVPESDLAIVSDALFAAGAGKIGAYEQCSFRLLGTGTFLPTAGTNPTIGRVGQREEVREYRLEVAVPPARLDAVIAAFKAAHSYEEPAFEWYPVQFPTTDGEGRIGELATPVSLGEFARGAQSATGSTCLQYVGDPSKPIRTVALACGAAGEFLKDAIRAKADLFVAGEVRFHEGLAAEEAGIGMILLGHYTSERPAIENLAAVLKGAFPEAKVWPSTRERDPFRTLD